MPGRSREFDDRSRTGQAASVRYLPSRNCRCQPCGQRASWRSCADLERVCPSFKAMRAASACILRRQHPSVVTQSEQNDRVGQCARRSSDDIPAAMRRWSPIAPVSTIVGSVSVNVRRRCRRPSIACRAVCHCVPLPYVTVGASAPRGHVVREPGFSSRFPCRTWPAARKLATS
jgi:hypothetical protein